MQVELRLLASMRLLLPESDRLRGATVFSLRDGATCKELLIRADVWGKSSLVVLVNGRYAAMERALSHGDVVAVFPPVGGG
ncbi:MAG: MoaD/ThiS family protein [Nitrospirota bacterium]